MPMPRRAAIEATLTVIDDSGTSSNTRSASALIVVNAPPVAKAGPDQLVTSSEVRFDGSGSSDPDGTIASYAWDFGDGTTGSGPKPVHVYRKAGTYLVRLTVTDDSGTIRSSASDTLHVVVNQAPVADAGPDQLAAPGQELTFDGSASQDPDGDVASWSWSFGDGTNADGQRVRHSYARPGLYQVQLTVHDNTGQANAIGYRPGEGHRQRAAGREGRAGPAGGARRQGDIGRLAARSTPRTARSRAGAGTSATAASRSGRRR